MDLHSWEELIMPERVEITGPVGDRYEEILTQEAADLLAVLHGELAGRRAELLAARRRRQAELSAGAMLDFLPATAHIREDSTWRIAPPAPGLVDRRVEITGPTDRKMTINALNSGANVWLADFEDANTPLWENMIGGQLNLKDALDRTIDFTSDDGKAYALGPEETLATIVVRPRGWHLEEKHILIDGARASGSLTDFALYMTTSARKQLDKGKGPYFYLAKMESYLEAQLWNDAFIIAQDALGIPQGTIRATCLIETIPAAFEMDEILFELRDHSAGLNAGRWDYQFSIIKKFRARGRDFVLPERNAVTMTAPFMRAYTELLVKTCHARSAHAMGGMAAFIPSRRDPEVNAADLLAVAKTPGGITEAGLRNNISVGLQYLANWLAGTGAVAIFNLMEDAATAEISRSQVWQWLHNDVTLAEGPQVTRDLVEQITAEELAKIQAAYGAAYDAAKFTEATGLFKDVALADDYADFLTLPAYEHMP